MSAKRFHRADDAVTSRMTGWCRRYPAKDLARVGGAEVSTAIGWRAGNWPSGPALRRMVATWGESFLAYVFAPLLAESDLSADRRLERIAADIAALREEQHADRRQDRRPSVDRGGRFLPPPGRAMAGDSAAQDGRIME